MSSTQRDGIRSVVARTLIGIALGVAALTTLVGAYVAGVVTLGYVAYDRGGWGIALGTVFATLLFTATVLCLAAWALRRRWADQKEKEAEEARLRAAAAAEIATDAEAELYGPPERETAIASIIRAIVGLPAGKARSSLLPAISVGVAAAAVFGPMRLLRLGMRLWSVYKTAELLASRKRSE